MALIFMPRRSGFIWMLVLGLLCLTEGIVKKELKTTLVGAVIVLYATINLILTTKKKQGRIENVKKHHNNENI